MISNVLTIAGSDPSGGAGIQADLKSFSALGCYGMAAITALTAQNTQGVYGVHKVPANFVREQIKALFEDIRIDAVKIGMVGNAEIVKIIASCLREYAPKVIVLDPVMVAQSGDLLIDRAASEALKEELIPLCSVLTPNLPEAHALLDIEGQEGDILFLARQLDKLGGGAVYLKGGHGDGALSSDLYYHDGDRTILEAPRIETKNNHGTGCTLSSALACFLAQGMEGVEAARAAKDYITGALEAGKDWKIGKGHGPVHHFYKVWA